MENDFKLLSRQREWYFRFWITPSLFLLIMTGELHSSPCPWIFNLDRLSSFLSRCLGGRCANTEIPEIHPEVNLSTITLHGGFRMVTVSGILVGSSESFLFEDASGPTSSVRPSLSGTGRASFQAVNLDNNKPEMRGEKRVLSVGEGIGGLVPHLIDRGFNATGLDLWFDVRPEEIPDALGKASMVYLLERYKRHLVAGSVLKIPFESNSFDTVFANALLNNLPEQQNLLAISEMVRVAKPGGQIVVEGMKISKEELIHFITSELSGSVHVGHSNVPGPIVLVKN
jgi:SAM-dependent methyltransferase